MISLSVIISDRYGSSMDDIWPNDLDGGRVSWLEAPDTPRGGWKMRRIGNSPAMHRLKAGHFTRADRVQIVAVPIIVASKDLTTPAPVIIYTSPEDPKNHEGDWESEVAWHRHLVHEVVVVPSSQTDGKMRFDQIVLAGRDGVDVLWFDGSVWKNFNVGEGLAQQTGNPYWGAGSVGVGRVDGDYAGYLCSAEVCSVDFLLLRLLILLPGLPWKHGFCVCQTRKCIARYCRREVDPACLG